MTQQNAVNYDNIYEVWCRLCQEVVKIKNPKTLRLPELCPQCRIVKVELLTTQKTNYRY